MRRDLVDRARGRKECGEREGEKRRADGAGHRWRILPTLGSAGPNPCPTCGAESQPLWYEQSVGRGRARDGARGELDEERS